MAVLLTTHLMEEAEALADDVVIVDNGRVVAQGSPAALTSTGPQQELRFRAKPGMDLTGLATALLVRHGTEAQRERWLPRIAQGDCVASFSITRNSGTSAMRSSAGLPMPWPCC